MFIRVILWIMRNTSTKIDIINKALAITSHGLLKNLSGSSELNIKVLLFYDMAYQALLALFPWHFATRRRQMTRKPAGANSGYSYRYTPPSDVLYIWEFAQDQSNYTNFGSAYNSSISIAYITVPLTSGTRLSSGVGEIIEQEIYSNFSQLWVFYTHSGAIEETAYTQQFVSLLVNALELDLSKAAAVDTDKLQTLERLHELKQDAQLRDQSIENKTTGKIPQARIVQRLQNLY